MVIDAAKGIEPRTLKLFEVCRLRDIPIVTFINKMDRETPRSLRDPRRGGAEAGARHRAGELADRPVQDLCGTYDLASDTVRGSDEEKSRRPVSGPDDASVTAMLPENERDAFVEETGLAREACKPFDREAFMEGHLTPVYFGSALKNYGVRDLIDALVDFGPAPRAQNADSRRVEATEDKMTAFVFKIQANMDPNHRDRIAFARVCSGTLARGMKAKLVRTGKSMTLSAPQFFFAAQRQLADEA